MAVYVDKTEDIAQDWVNSDYYEVAETPEWSDGFWSAASPFRRLFAQLDLRDTIELACGHGRHAARILDMVGRLILVDVNRGNIEACQKRFAGRSNIKYVVNNGYDLAELGDVSASAVFCYDAMVHFEADAVLSYLSEIFRVLRAGGRTLLHHSNYDSKPGGDYRQNPHMRNFMTSRLLQHFAIRRGFEVRGAEYLDWGSEAKLDGLLLLERPAL
jgi:ubiquinone/menaquinone biosynthesis C-methylase UbiE